MPNLSMNETTTLENLLTALRAGLPASQGYNILQDTLSQQRQRVTQNKERLQSMAQLVAEQAMGGATYDQTSTLMDLVTSRPGVPGKVQGMLDTAYPGMTSPFVDASPYSRDIAQMSPMYQPPPLDTGEMRAQFEFEQGLAMDQEWELFTEAAYEAKNQGYTMQQFMQLAAKEQTNLIAADPTKANKIAQSVFFGFA